MATALTFIAFVVLFTVVGLYSATQKQDTMADYLLAGRKVNPWLVALSALSTGQSGFLFTAQVGYSYSIGLASIWLAIGWAEWVLVYGTGRVFLLDWAGVYLAGDWLGDWRLYGLAAGV